MQSIRKYVFGVFIVVALSLALPTYAAPPAGNTHGDSLLVRLKAFIVKAFDYSGISLPPG
jgi:hypothetical protein